MGGKVSYTSIKKYEDKAYDKITLRVKKGNRAIIKTAAKAAGETANYYINMAIKQRLERENAPNAEAFELLMDIEKGPDAETSEP